VFVTVRAIRAIRQRCGPTQREARLVFGTDEKSFEKYGSEETQPSASAKRLPGLTAERPGSVPVAEKPANSFLMITFDLPVIEDREPRCFGRCEPGSIELKK